MPRMIDADALPYENQVMSVDEEWCLKCGDIDAAPTIDPIRAAGGCYCRECEFSIPSDYSEHALKCIHWQMDCNKNGFCSYGKPKEAQDA